MSNFKIMHATLADMHFLLDLAEKEGWNPGLEDANPFYYTDPHGFFIGELDEEKIGCISAVAYNADVGFLGFYIVIPSYRGQGWGIQLWKHGMHYLGNRCIGLDGVIAQQENYKKSHFQLYYRNIRFEGQGFAYLSNALINLKDISFDTLLKYDTSIFGLARPTFLKYWIEMPHAYSLGKIDHNRLTGYGVIRRCIKGYKIGPLFADHFEIAQEIYQALAAKAENQTVFLDIPEVNPCALKLAEEAKLQKVFETARMYNKTPPPQQLNKIFGVTSFELG
jgi:ribosomal protein S18 acetylase RimI-like enzyme